jgi:hypothetical protein
MVRLSGPWCKLGRSMGKRPSSMVRLHGSWCKPGRSMGKRPSSMVRLHGPWCKPALSGTQGLERVQELRGARPARDSWEAAIACLPGGECLPAPQSSESPAPHLASLKSTSSHRHSLPLPTTCLLPHRGKIWNPSHLNFNLLAELAPLLNLPLVDSSQLPPLLT